MSGSTQRLAAKDRQAGRRDVNVRVLAGDPTASELAAIIVALERHRARDPDAQRPKVMARWVRAARLEACGHPPVDSAAALTR